MSFSRCGSARRSSPPTPRSRVRSRASTWASSTSPTSRDESGGPTGYAAPMTGAARALARSRASEPLDVVDVLAVLTATDDDLGSVLAHARHLRDAYPDSIGLPGAVTYSRKVCIPLTYLCRYRCSYCTFVTPR